MVCLKRGGDGNRTRVHGFAGRCLTTRPHRQPGRVGLRADDGIRTRDPHLGKVMRYQLRYIRTHCTVHLWCRVLPAALSTHPAARENISPPSMPATNPQVEPRELELQLCSSAARSPRVPVCPAPLSPTPGPPVGSHPGPWAPIPSLALFDTPNPQVDPRFGVTRGMRVKVPSRSEKEPCPSEVSRSYSSAGERSPHTREVAGSKPARTTT